MFSKLYTTIFSNKKTLPSKLKISDFNEVRNVYDDVWNKVPNSYVELTYFDKNNQKRLATISYKLQSGQIGKLFIHDAKLHRRSLGTQMLEKAIDEIKNRNSINPDVKEIWAVSTHDNFFLNVFNKSFKKRIPAHPSVLGPGYYMNISGKIENSDNKQ